MLLKLFRDLLIVIDYRLGLQYFPFPQKRAFIFPIPLPSRVFSPRFVVVSKILFETNLRQNQAYTQGLNCVAKD
jgi:hypothetical protein